MAESEMPSRRDRLGLPDVGIDLDQPVVNAEHGCPQSELWDDLFFDIDAKAREVLSDMDAKPRERKMAPRDWQWWAYSLTEYAAFQGRAVPTSLLQLLFRALDCKSGYLPDEVKAVLREPPGKIARRDEWREAVRIVAAEPDISLKGLADRVGIDRKMTREWRESDEFRQAVIDEEFGLRITGQSRP